MPRVTWAQRSLASKITIPIGLAVVVAGSAYFYWTFTSNFKLATKASSLKLLAGISNLFSCRNQIGANRDRLSITGDEDTNRLLREAKASHARKEPIAAKDA